jgi:hypothetical protein
MQDYRVYVMSHHGRIMDRIEFYCASDDEAKERAKQLVDGHDVELWHRDQRLAVFRRTDAPGPT